MSKFQVQLLSPADWANTFFNHSSLWGGGNTGKDAWGYLSGESLNVDGPYQDGNEWYIDLILGSPFLAQGTHLAFITRYILPGGTNGVFCSLDLVPQ